MLAICDVYCEDPNQQQSQFAYDMNHGSWMCVMHNMYYLSLSSYLDQSSAITYIVHKYSEDTHC